MLVHGYRANMQDTEPNVTIRMLAKPQGHPPDLHQSQASLDHPERNCLKNNQNIQDTDQELEKLPVESLKVL